MLRTTVLLALFCMANAAKQVWKDPEIEIPVPEPLEVPPGFAVKPDHDTFSELLERMDDHTHEATSELLQEYELLAGKLKAVDAALIALGDSLDENLPTSDVSGEFTELKQLLHEVKQAIIRKLWNKKNMIKKAVEAAANKEKKQLKDTESALKKAIWVAKKEEIGAVQDIQEGINKTIDWTNAAILEAIEVSGEGLFNALDGSGQAIESRVGEASDMTLERIDAVLEDVEAALQKSAKESKNAAARAGQKNKEAVAALKEQVSAKVSAGQDEAFNAVNALTARVGEANNNLGERVEQAVEQSTAVIGNQVDANNSGLEEELKKISAAVVDRVTRNLKKKVAALDEEVKGFLTERINPIYEGLNYVAERAFKNSLAIQFTKLVLKQVAKGDCHGGYYDVEETPDERIRKMDYSGF